MTQEEWDATPIENREAALKAEFEKCKDPVYLYNTYYVNKDGSKPEPITREYWDELMQIKERQEFNRFRNYRRRIK